MRRPPSAAVFPLFVALAFPAKAQTVEANPGPSRDLIDPRINLLDEGGLILAEVTLDQLAITDALGIYDSPAGLLIPVGELSRLLDADLVVRIGEGQITGSMGEARRPVLANARFGIVRLGGTTELLIPGDMVIGTDEIYVRAALLEKLLPVSVSYDPTALSLNLKARERLPIQSRLDRLARLRGLQNGGGGGGGATEVYRVRNPSNIFTLPSIDVSLEAGAQRRTPKYPYRYDVRAAGDLLFGNFQGFVGSDNRGKPATARAVLERRDADGNALGPFGFTKAAIGDIFTPALPLGARSLAGRGVTLSTAPLTQQSVFGRIDLRGELPLGFDVELYINDILRSGQATPVQGRYEFRDVPLVRGINIIRVVAYGPRGERTEDVRVVNVGGGQLEKGQFTIDVGAAQQEKTVFNFDSKDSGTITAPGEGDLRAAVSMAYGLSEAVTLAGGVATYSPNNQNPRIVGTMGIRTSIAGISTQADVARDDEGGTAAAVALAGEMFGLSTVVRHSEYRRGFIDETLPRATGGQALRRATEIDVDFQLPGFNKDKIPVSVRMSRDQLANGDLFWNGLVRTSMSLGGINFSTGADYARMESATGTTTDQLFGFLTASSFALFKWQLRATLDYSVIPRTRIGSLSLTADRDLAEDLAVRLGLGHSFQGGRETSLQFSLIRRFGFGDASLDGFYSRPGSDWRIGLQLAVGLVRNPLGGGYRFTRPGAASGAGAAIQAFLDANGNDRFDKGEEPVPGVGMLGHRGEEILTDERGRALVTGLGYASIAQLRTNLDNVQLDNVAGPPSVIEFTPRAGQVAVIPYPVQAKGEVMVSIGVRRGEKFVGLSAVMLRLVGEKGQIREGTTEYDGSVLFDGLRPGTYRVELEPEQSKRLKMRLTAPASITISGDGGAAPDLAATVVFDDAH